MVEGSPPYLEESALNAILMIRTRGRPEIDIERYSPILQDFLYKCLEVDVKKRCTASQLLKVS